MHPPTPFPATARSKFKNQNEPRGTAFRDITSKTNVISKSAQEPFNAIKKRNPEEKTTGTSKTPAASRRYSISSRFAGPKADNCPTVSNPLHNKPKLNKRASLQGAINETLLHSASTENGNILNKITTAPSSKLSSNSTAISSVQGRMPAVYLRRQFLASGHSIKTLKACTDLVNPSVPGVGKTYSMSAPINKERGLLLKSASYWVEQVKLAEMLENHGVAIGFFRLAIECGAEPIQLLREELIAFIEKYMLWSDSFQQLLVCYGVTAEDQEALLSRLATSGLRQSSISSSGVVARDNFPADTQVADKVSQILPKSLDQDFQNASEKHSVEDTAREGLQIPTDNDFECGITGHSEDMDAESVKNMDAESITKLVVSRILSSMNVNKEYCSSPKCGQPSQNFEHETHHLTAEGLVFNSTDSVAESISVPNSGHPDECISSDSLSSLNVGNTIAENLEAYNSAKEKEPNPELENVPNDSKSASTISGEEMSISMELVDTLSNELESSTSTHFPTQESESNASQSTIEVTGDAFEGANVVENGNQTMLSGQICDSVSQTIHTNYVKAQGRNQNMGSATKKATTKVKTELPCLQSTSEPQIQYERRRCKSSQDKKPTPVSEIMVKIPVGKAMSTGTPRLKGLSMSTPKTATARRPSKATPKSPVMSRSIIPTEQGAAYEQRQLAARIDQTDNNMVTPPNDRSMPTQVSAIGANDNGKQTTDNNSVFVTPGSAGLRRSARLIKTAGVFTPDSVSTPRL